MKPAMNKRRMLALLLSLNALLILPWLGLTPFYTRGEPREAIVAQSILRQSSWALPSGYGYDVPSKPPFLHWMIAVASLSTNQVSEFNSRLPSALVAIGFVGFFYCWSRKYIADEIAALSSFILMTSFEWLRASQGCRVDLIHSAALAITMCLIFDWRSKNFAGIPIAAIISLAVATLTKGPVALVLSAGVVSAEIVFNKLSFKRTLAYVVPVFIAALAITSIWYILAYVHGGSQFWEMVVDENFRRFTSSMEDTPHKHGVMYLFGTTFLGLMPWSLFATLPLVKWLLSLSKKQARSDLRLAYKSSSEFSKFCLFAALTIFCFYCIPASKRSVYVLAAYPFFALGLSKLVVAQVSYAKKYTQTSIAIFSLVAAILLALVAIAIYSPIEAVVSSFSKSPEALFYIATLRSDVVVHFSAGLIFLLAILFLFVAYKIFQPSFATEALIQSALAFVLLLILINSTIMPAIGRAVSPHEFSKQIADRIDSRDRLYSFGSEFYATSFDLNRSIYPLSRLESDVLPMSYVLVEDKNFNSLRALIPVDRQIRILDRSKSNFLKPNNQALLVRID